MRQNHEHAKRHHGQRQDNHRSNPPTAAPPHNVGLLSRKFRRSRITFLTRKLFGWGRISFPTRKFSGGRISFLTLKLFGKGRTTLTFGRVFGRLHLFGLVRFG